MAMHSGNTGAQLMTYGITVLFKPWYFDGRIVYWGELETTRSDAQESAERIKRSVQSRQGGFVSNW